MILVVRFNLNLIVWKTMHYRAYFFSIFSITYNNKSRKTVFLKLNRRKREREGMSREIEEVKRKREERER